MDAHKRYALRLLSLILAMMLTLVVTGFYLQPLAGDVTRIGDYSENDFGWNQPQPVFDRPAAAMREAYDQYVDVLALGDSFSFGGLYGMLNFPWQTFFAADSGLSIATISHYTHTDPPDYDSGLLAKIVNSEAFQKTPPRVLILEVVERQLHMLPGYVGNCQAEHKITQRFVFTPTAAQFAMHDENRSKVRSSLKKQIAYALKYLLGSVQRLWEKNPAVYQLALDAPGLLSHKLSDRLLVYEGDVKKRAWDEQKIAVMRCKLMNAQNLVQKNGKTLFLAMIVPDKLTAYSRRLKDQSFAHASVIERLAADKSLHLVRLDQAMQAAIAEGAVDVYLPNDTHWASRGHKIAAATVARYLQSFPGD